MMCSIACRGSVKFAYARALILHSAHEQPAYPSKRCSCMQRARH